MYSENLSATFYCLQSHTSSISVESTYNLMISVSNHFEIGIGWSVRSLFLHDHCAENFEKRKVVAINEEASSFYRTTLAWTWSTALFVIIFKVNLMLFLLRSSMRYFLTTTVIQVILRKQS